MIPDEYMTVLRMLSEYVGEENFLKGVSIYLKKRLYGSSVTSDLWDGISEAAGNTCLAHLKLVITSALTASGVNVNDLMNNWILKVQPLSFNLFVLFTS